MTRGEGYTYIKQVTTQKLRSLNFTVFKNNYLGLCVRAPLLAVFVCPSARIYALWPRLTTYHCTDMCTWTLKVKSFDFIAMLQSAVNLKISGAF
jgi:hypothetical protein